MLAHEAVRRVHRVCYITPGDFVLTPDNILRIHARFAPEKKGRSFVEFFKGMEAVADKTEAIDISEVEVLMLRSDPSLAAQAHPWAEDLGIVFGRAAATRGVLVLNAPDRPRHAITRKGAV